MSSQTTIKYSTSKKKLYLYGVAWLVIVLVVMVAAMLKKSDPILIAAILAIFTGYILFMMRRIAKQAICTNCGADLFEVIEQARNSKVDFRYCPQCGNNVDISA